MKKITLLFLSFSSLFIGACNNTKEKGAVSNEKNATDTTSVNTNLPTAAAGENNTVALIQKTLMDLHKDDLAKNLIDSMGRQFKYSEYDLNGDGTLEILVGLTGSFFCGSGGCTLYLLTHQGDMITKFSVVKYPVYADTKSNMGWKNLIMYSGGEHRVVQWDGKSYPPNPSTLAKAKTEPGDQQTKLLDWEISKGYTY